MINPLELRLGNYVLYNGQIAVVSGINSPAPRKDKNFDGKYVIELVLDGLIDCTPEELEPIILTEELLLKFGFNKIDDKYNYFDTHNIPGILQLFDGVAEYSIDSNNVCWVNNLHQLQNLIFSISDIELKNG